MKKTILVFPAGMPLALDFLKRMQLESYEIIGASSVPHDPARLSYSA